jgi:tetratricopeptide (TPR) repeat protein
MIAVAVVVVGGAAAFLVVRARTSAPSAAPGPAAVAPTAELPDPDTSRMQPRVRAVVEEARAAVVARPDEATAWARYGGVLDAHGLFAEAEACYRQTLALAPEDFTAHYLVAIVAEMRGGDPEETIALFRRASELEPEFPPVFYRLGEALARQGRLEEASSAFRRAIELEAALAVAHRGLGQVLVQLGEAETAIDHLRTAEALTPGDVAVYTALAQAYTQLGDADQAETFADRARTAGSTLTLPDPIRFGVRALSVSSEVCLERGQEAMRSGDFDAAIRDFTIVAETRPDDVEIQNLLGRAYANKRAYDDARRHLERALEIDETHAPSHFALSHIHRNSGRPAEALHHLERASELRPFNATYATKLASLLAVLDHAEEAIAAYEQAAALGALPARDQRAWAETLVRLERYDEALAQYEVLIGIQPENTDAYFAMGLIHERAGRVDEARASYAIAARLDPAHAAARRLVELDGGAEPPP